jgi:serine/threonine protein kinase/Tol biopolymer transport system component
MTPERYQAIARLYHAAMEMERDRRATFLEQACAGDEELRREVESLIASDEEAVDFIEAPALEVAAEMLAAEQGAGRVGRQVSHYRILSLLGAGGMGEVYLAEDMRLRRRIALKLLPAQFTHDANRVRRFKQEAVAASSLNHPNIITIHEIGQVDGTHYIATEFIDGQTLRERLKQERLTIRETMDLAAQVASALVAAHEAGIIHRDIKPENIMVRRDGIVKILDFGLVKLAERERQMANTEAPTIAKANTDPGTVMGTAGYMSPEQARGQTVDARTDIFSLGVVIYEMIAGQAPFEGVNAIEVMGEILNRAPQPLSQHRTDVPAELQRIVGKALRKDREERYQVVKDLLVDLKDLKRELELTARVEPSSQTWGSEGQKSEGGSLPDQANYETAQMGAIATGGSSLVRTTSSAEYIVSEIKRHKTGALLTLALFTAACVAAAYLLMKLGKQTPIALTSIKNLTFDQLTNLAGQELFPSLSPDGKLMIYAATQAGNWDIYFQRVGGETPINLTPDSAAHDTQPAFSPNGEMIAFRSERDGGGIFLMGATGENVRRLTTQGYYPAWSPDGQEIVYALGFFNYGPHNRSIVPSSLHVVNVQTGATRLLTAGDAVQPNWSPHHHRIAYWGIQRGGQRDIWTIATAGGTPVPVTDDGAIDWNPVWSPDGQFLYFASDRSGSMNLWRVPIDEQTGQVRGAPEPVTTPATYSSYISFARDGQRLVYVESKNQINLQEVAFDPVKKRVIGTPQWITRGSRTATQQHLSFDQQWIVFNSIGDRQEDLFIVRRDGTGMRQLINDSFKDRAPRWSPDGKRIIFFTDRTGRYELWQINPDGSDVKQLTWTTGAEIQMPHWSPDGQQILCSLQYKPPFLMDPARPWSQQTPQSLPEEGYPEGFLVSSWSPDGQKLIGHRNGVVTFSFATQKYERLTDSGHLPLWLNDSRHALFIATDKLILVDTHTRQITEVLSVAPRLLQFISVSRDNHFISLSVNTTESDIWMATLPQNQ